MGSYLNPRNKGFYESINSPIYVDKTALIEKTNAVLNTRQKFLCVSRPRRFGKSMAADMLAAYYERESDSAELFDSLAISRSESYRKHRNQYDVLKINMQDFLSVTSNMEEMLRLLQERILADLKQEYPDITDGGYLVFMMQDIYIHTKRPFIILIDEWDCLFREYQQDKESQKKYLDFLRAWLKDKDYVALAYMTGILPIKKYGSHSALNMFTEYSMTDPDGLAEYFGFTESEVQSLCREYQMNFEEAQAWYDGYRLITHTAEGTGCHSIYSPKSVVEAMLRHKYGTYWNQTETYEALKVYIHTGTFENDMTTFATKDDILTLLVHLGYLTYDSIQETVSIPNKEVSLEYMNAIRTMDWHEVVRTPHTATMK